MGKAIDRPLKKEGKGFRITLLSICGVLLAVGMILYFASYFWGGLLILLAGVLIFIATIKEKGKKEALRILLSYLKKLLIPAIGIIAAILIGAIVMLITKYNPIKAYAALFYGGLVKNWSVSVLNATPLIFTGLSVALAFKAGLFNIGAEGQYYMGAMMATWLAMRFSLPIGLFIPLIFILGSLMGAAWNIIPAALKVGTGAHEVVTTMMLARVAIQISTIFVRKNGGDPATSAHAYVTDPILKDNWLLNFKTFLPEANYRIHIGILIAVAVAILVYYFLYKTTLGFEIRAVGENSSAAKTQGIAVGRTIIIALLLAGLLAGMAGVVQVTGLEHKMSHNLNAGYGWNGISVALLAGNNPIGVIFAALLWGILDAGGQYMARKTGTPNAVIEIIKGIILFLILAKYLYGFILKRFKKPKNKEPKDRESKSKEIKGDIIAKTGEMA